MTLDQKIQQMAAGEYRLDPDQQRYYLGTFGERLVLSARLEQASQPQLLEALPDLLADYQARYANLQLKISSQLDNAIEMTLMTTAQSLHLPATIVDETGATCPFGWLLHTNQAEHLTDTDIQSLHPQLFSQKLPEKAPSFWQKLFRKGRTS